MAAAAAVQRWRWHFAAAVVPQLSGPAMAAAAAVHAAGRQSARRRWRWLSGHCMHWRQRDVYMIAQNVDYKMRYHVL